VEDGATRMMFVGVRRSLNGIAMNAGLLAKVAEAGDGREGAGGREKGCKRPSRRRESINGNGIRLFPCVFFSTLRGFSAPHRFH